MLRITSNEAPDRLVLKLEGKLVGAWVPELESCSRSTVTRSGSRPLVVDITDVQCIDAAGRYTLALLHLCGAQLTASGPMSDLVHEIIKSWPAAVRA